LFVTELSSTHVGYQKFLYKRQMYSGCRPDIWINNDNPDKTCVSF